MCACATSQKTRQAKLPAVRSRGAEPHHLQYHCQSPMCCPLSSISREASRQFIAHQPSGDSSRNSADEARPDCCSAARASRGTAVWAKTVTDGCEGTG
ncbi:hypothetical protein IG631_11162 [Alternaria alternata]|nr:hypothetical protein IG631_11162 [Alternaria alternata]